MSGGQEVAGSNPSSITLPDHIWNTGGIPWPGQGGGFLGRLNDPWLVHCDPSKLDFEIAGLSLPEGMAADRINDRAGLWETMQRRFSQAGLAQSRQMRDAFAMIRTGPIAKAFKIHEESEKTRERYGSNRWGQSLLLTRRLVEAGDSYSVPHFCCVCPKRANRLCPRVALSNWPE